MARPKKEEKKLFEDFVSEKGEPHALDLEEAVLGAMMLEQPVVEIVFKIAQSSEIFFKAEHQTIYSAILKLREEGNPIEPLTVCDILRREEKLESVGGAFFVTELTMKVASTANVEYHTMILFQYFTRRNLTKFAMSLYGQATDLTNDEFETFDTAISKLDKLKVTIASLKEIDFNKQVDETMKEVLDALNGKSTSIKTGFMNVDAITGGRFRGELTILAARPSMGKTSRMIKEMMNVALGGHYTVGLISLETKYNQIIKKVLSNMAKVDSNLIRLAELDMREYDALFEAHKILKQHRFLISDVTTMKLSDIRVMATKWKTQNNLDILYIDYLTLIKQQSDYKSTNDEVGKIANGLKNIAMDLDIPIVCLAQLNREAERRGEKRPILSDLRDSGDIEQAADVASFLFRPEYYGELLDSEGNSLVGITEELIKKNRNGVIGDAYHKFSPAICDFEPLGFVPNYGKKTSNSFSQNGHSNPEKFTEPASKTPW
jgi:replicative DNA helicase